MPSTADEIASMLDNFHIFQIERNAAECPLLTIPAELRNIIYEDILGGWEVHLKFTEEVKSHRKYECYCDSKQHHWKGLKWSQIFRLPLVCRQIHEETRLLPFQLNTFVIDPVPEELLRGLSRGEESEYINATLDHYLPRMTEEQINTITSLAPPYKLLTDLWKEPFCLSKIFTGVKEFVIKDGNILYVTIAGSGGVTRQATKAEVINRVREKEGDDVEVIVVDEQKEL
ncbi:hypothetical protein BDV96DRAFT_643656 [Lophiotrema nucula]|uniref:DUF7730 domain-containing protein n=1 Tax=Lophiotrema nucula TaxID=690887 RepID=A0A6A5ZFY4_9PLEO|nr:hypothetical protein BDV96DRAFT_643656 [Lophiotrema nucula]